jgi:hypothetical protein
VIRAISPHSPSSIAEPKNVAGNLPLEAGGGPVPETANGREPGVAIEISDAGRRLSLAFQEYGTNAYGLNLETYALETSKDARERRHADFAAKEEAIASLDPFDRLSLPNYARAAVIFPDGSVEEHIADSLAGRVKDEFLIAGELGAMLRSAASKRGETVEQRAAVRETALRNAEALAGAVFESDAERNGFLSGIYKAAENDVMREKGYIVRPGADPYPRYTMPSASGGHVNIGAFAQLYEGLGDGTETAGGAC